MDQTALVKSDRDAGAHLMEALSRRKIPVTLFDWTYVPQLEEWQIVVATPWYDSKGPLTAYRALVDALQTAGVYAQVPMRRVSVRSPGDPLVKVLEREVKEKKEGFIHVLRFTDTHKTSQYSVMFAPIAGLGGAMLARRFSGIEMARTFLTEDIGVRSSAVEQALDEVKRTGAGSIYPVTLTTRQLRKLGLL
jgi:hypothetical protein